MDLLGCMGVVVQRNLCLTTATHVVARDVELATSDKLQAARK